MEAVFPFYIVHQTALVLCAHAVRTWSLPVGAEAAIILGATAAACLAADAVARRITFLRPLFGLRLHPPPHPAPHPPPEPAHAR